MVFLFYLPCCKKAYSILYFEFPEIGRQLAVRIGNWKGVKRNPKTAVKREHRPSHIQDWEFVDPKFEIKNNILPQLS